MPANLRHSYCKNTSFINLPIHLFIHPLTWQKLRKLGTWRTKPVLCFQNILEGDRSMDRQLWTNVVYERYVWRVQRLQEKRRGWRTRAGRRSSSSPERRKKGKKARGSFGQEKQFHWTAAQGGAAVVVVGVERLVEVLCSQKPEVTEGWLTAMVGAVRFRRLRCLQQGGVPGSLVWAKNYRPLLWILFFFF